MRGRTFSCSLLYPSNYQNVHCGHLLCRPQNIFCQLHYCLAGVVDVGIWLIFFQNLISFNHFLQFLWYELEIFVPLPTGGVGAFMLEGVCVSPCSTSCDASAVSTDCLVVVWRLYTSYPETRLATFLQSSSTVPPLHLHSFTIKPLDLHWTYTGAALDSPSTATNTYPLSHFTHTTTPSQSVAALQRCTQLF